MSPPAYPRPTSKNHLTPTFADFYALAIAMGQQFTCTSVHHPIQIPESALVGTMYLLLLLITTTTIHYNTAISRTAHP